MFVSKVDRLTCSQRVVRIASNSNSDSAGSAESHARLVHLLLGPLAMDAEKRLQQEHLSRQRRPPSRISQVGRYLLVFCAAIQATFLFAGLSGPGRFSYFRAAVLRRSSRAGQADPAEEWRDDVFPIREQTPWDISTDFPYSRTLTFDVNEGTWLRLDVHPVSGEVVFDMLGDIYCLPASAYLQPGTGLNELARPILLGVPHDADPHFSPDGKLLAFRSDAELGIDNIWVTEWKGCEQLDLRPITDHGHETDTELSQALQFKESDESMLASGIKETPDRRLRRLLREGRSKGSCKSRVKASKQD